MTAQRYAYQDLLSFSSQLLTRAGLPQVRAEVVARQFLEADLLGYSTHGVQRLPSNCDWLLKGETNPDGRHIVLQATRCCETWDADFLPGPWVAAQAVDRACEMAAENGLGSVVVRRTQHVACLASYLERGTDRRMMVMITVSTPAEAVVAAHGGLTPIFSCNPFAAGIPTGEAPILIDTTLAMSAQGPMNRAQRQGTMLPYPMIMRPDGDVSANPADFAAGGAILPLGGIEQGHKGTGLVLLTKALTAALGGYGRADGAEIGEANALFVQVLDPAHFAGRAVFEREMRFLAQRCRASRVAPGSDPVRVAGDRALMLKRDQLRDGVRLLDSILDDIRPWAERLDCTFPAPIARS
ncbi:MULTISPECIES: Ldh family oxidoreductase [unclassified Mesorhizobium]|uniref:Ldh family oxidoreductase n=1 Tax=unclassified Mesorhizobium TaxID=325217 RepID=UPI000FE857FA|nr:MULTISPECIES: Ldh family oxidoreductase [unclassified Mesorhizobium]RWB94708.1 MAG: Ldh family oxidoreductase [Mesorhizobium sp.]TGV18202.1 Ldh family oxidoreductase [Mesorhizobium sp. M4B.F.Ca.ET.143.01.1.1]